MSFINFSHKKYNMPDISKRSVVFLIAISALFIALSVCMASPQRPIEEDSFITFRYVENFLNGNGFVFNKSEKVEGISNFSWAVMLAILSKCGFSYLPTAAMLGLGFGILVIWTVWLFSVLYLKRESYFQFIAPLLLATHTFFVTSCANGLETAFYTFLITIGTISFVLESREKETFPYFAIIFSLASITRPEAPLFFLAIMLTLIYRDMINRKLRRYTIISFTTFFLVYGIFIVFRIYYYHDIFPNTAYYKSSIDFLYKGNPNLNFLFAFIVSTKSYFIFLPALLLFKAYRKEPFYQFVTVITVGIVIMIFLTEPEPRFLLPMLPLSFILVQEGLFRFSIILKDFSSVKRGYKKSFAFLLMASILLTNLLWHEVPIFKWNLSARPGEPVASVIGKMNPLVLNLKTILAEPSIIKRKFEAFTGKKRPQNSMVSFGYWIKENLPEGSIILYDQMGQTPFYAGLSYTFIDAWGLTDKTIAYIQYRRSNDFLFKIQELVLRLSPGVNAITYQEDLTLTEYILSREPDYIFINLTSLHTYLLSDEFNHRYQKFFPDTPQTFEACYRRK